MRCGKCGTRIVGSDPFCPYCGMRVAGAGREREEGEPRGEGTEGTGVPGGDQAASGAPERTSAAIAAGSPPTCARRTSGLAVASLVLGVAGLFLCPVAGAALAVAFGAIARKEIRRSRGNIEGYGMATAGLVLGTIGLAVPALLVVILVPVGIVYVRPEVRAVEVLRDGADAAQTYYFENGDSYRGMRPADLERIDGDIDFRVAPGRSPEVVYVERVADRSVRLYCYSSRGHRHTASARDDEWRYSFGAWGWRFEGPRRWFE